MLFYSYYRTIKPAFHIHDILIRLRVLRSVHHSSKIKSYKVVKKVEISVADPDPQDPYVLSLPDPDLLVRGTHPDPDPAPIPDNSIIKQKQKEKP